MILEHATLEVWYEYDILADTWTDISSTMQAALPTTWAETEGHRFVVPTDDCGVLLYWKHFHDTWRVFLYKHSDQPRAQSKRPLVEALIEFWLAGGFSTPR